MLTRKTQGLDERTVKRILRFSCTQFIFTEDPKGVIRHNAASKCLLQQPKLNEWVCMASEDVLLSCVKVG